MVSEKFKILVGKVKKRLSELKPEDIAKFAIKEAAGSIPIVGQYITDAIEEFSPDEKFELLQELKLISETQFAEISKEIGVSVEYLKDIKIFTYNEFKIQKADHEEIKGLLLRLIKNQTKFEIGQQKAEIIYNVAGDIIIHHPITREPVSIPSIQSVLKKDEIEDGKFFRKEPAWVDFEQGCIVERYEADEIINSLEKEKVQLVLGAPASGKSIILKNLGYKLANVSKKVHIVELKKHPIDEIKLFFENIPKIDNESIFIVDDAHLYLSYCERLAKDFESKGKGNLIIGSRETREITEEHPKEGAEYELLSELSKTCIHVQAEDVTEGMIRTFLEKQYHFDEEKINIISSNLDKYKKDLWLLSWALIAYNNDKESVVIDEIYEKIARAIEEIKVGKDKVPINAEDVLLPLSIFYRFEIPIERYFLEEQLGIEKNIINQLIAIQEIAETKRAGHKMLSLHHSSLAELYFGAYQGEPDLGRRIKNTILKGRDEKDLVYCSFYRYLTSTAGSSLDVVISLGRDFSDEKGGKKLLRELIGIDKIQKSIEKGIEKEEDLIKVGNLVTSFAAVNENRAMELADSISARIEKEEDLANVGKCVAKISWTNKDVAAKLADSISSRMNKEKDIEKVLRLISVIARPNEELFSKLVDSISTEISTEIIYNAPFIETIGAYIFWFKEVELKLINRIDIVALSSRIDKEEDIGKVCSFISVIAKANKEVAMKLVDSVSARIDKEEDIGKVGMHLFDILWNVNKEVGKKLVNSIDINALSSKIDEESDLKKIGSCVSDIERVSREVAMKLANSIEINTLSSKINKEVNIEKVGVYVSQIAGASEEAGMKLVNSIDINALSSKINKEENIEKVGMCISGIAEASEEAGMKLVNSIDINALSSKINNEEDIENIRRCVSGIAGASKEVAMKLVNNIDIHVLSFKLNKEEGIRKIGMCISGIAGASEEVGMKLANRIDINALSSKIYTEGNVGIIGVCISGIAEASEEVGMKLANRIDISALSSKIKMVDVTTGMVEWFMSGIAKASKEVANKIVNQVNLELGEELLKQM